jgi:hypothetical protein
VYKAPNGNWYTQALFVETHQELETTGFQPIFTLYGERDGYISARKTFVELGDPTGYKWAMEYLGDYNHWHKLMQSPWFRDAYDVWIAELNAKNQSEAISRILEISKTDSPQALPAAKYIAESGWSKPAAKRGRPSKAEITGELKEAVRVAENTADDMKRIGLRLVK